LLGSFCAVAVISSGDIEFFSVAYCCPPASSVQKMTRPESDSAVEWQDSGQRCTDRVECPGFYDVHTLAVDDEGGYPPFHRDASIGSIRDANGSAGVGSMLAFYAEIAEEPRSQRRYFWAFGPVRGHWHSTTLRRPAAQMARPDSSGQKAIFLCDLIFLGDLCV
jgi:hypothetical protein